MCVVTTASVLVRRGANALPYLVESAVFICGNFRKNAQLQINGGYYLSNLLCEYSLACSICCMP